MTSKQDLHYTHPSNFYPTSLRLMNDAWVVHKKNLSNDKAKSGKKSHSESGDAALAILILVIKFEADLRSRYDYITNRSDENSMLNPLEILGKLTSHFKAGMDIMLIEKYKQYMNELLLVRNIIAHGYLYEGEIYFDDNWEIRELKGSNVTGRDRGKLNSENETKLLKIQTSPYEMCVFDSVTVYKTIEVLREMTDLHFRTENILHEGEYIEMHDWLAIAVDGIDEEIEAVHKSLHTDYYHVMGTGIDI